MINKLIYFTWFGNTIPDFLSYTMSVFKQVNPDYKFILITRSISELNDIYYSNSNKLSKIDNLIKQSLIEHVNIQIKLKLMNKENRPVITAFNDIFRLKILNLTGGIYLDSDMFPIKPFDDKLLQLDSFLNSRSSYNASHLLIEQNFAGSIKGFNYVFEKILPPIYEFELKTTELLNKFYLCKILYGDHYGNPKYNYVDHYGRYLWNPSSCLIPKTAIDKELENIYSIKINFIS